MSMIDVIRKEMMTAMKNKDKERKESLSMLLSALKNAQIDKREDLTEAEENTIIAKEIKQTIIANYCWNIFAWSISYCNWSIMR